MKKRQRYRQTPATDNQPLEDPNDSCDPEMQNPSSRRPPSRSGKSSIRGEESIRPPTPRDEQWYTGAPLQAGGVKQKGDFSTTPPSSSASDYYEDHSYHSSHVQHPIPVHQKPLRRQVELSSDQGNKAEGGHRVQDAASGLALLSSMVPPDYTSPEEERTNKKRASSPDSQDVRIIGEYTIQPECCQGRKSTVGSIPTMLTYSKNVEHSQRPQVTQTLFDASRCSHKRMCDVSTQTDEGCGTLIVEFLRLTQYAIPPARMSRTSELVELYAAHALEIRPHEAAGLRLDWMVRMPAGVHARVVPHKNASLTAQCNVFESIIPSRSKLNATIYAYNYSSVPCLVRRGDQVATLSILRGYHVILDLRDMDGTPLQAMW